MYNTFSMSEFEARTAYALSNVAACEQRGVVLTESEKNQVFNMCVAMWKHVRASKGFTK